MPPSIPTSLNFGQSNAPPAFYSWPKSVLSFLGQVLRPKQKQLQEGSGGGGDSSGHASSSAGSKVHPLHHAHHVPSRKVSRADAAEALAAMQAGIQLLGLDIGLAPVAPLGSEGDEDEVDLSSESGQRQALLQATEQVVASVRTLLAQRSRARARAQHDPDGADPAALLPPRILLFGRHAEMRAQYLAHSCGFGVESGNNPSDCTWPLLFPLGAADAAAGPAFSSAASGGSDQHDPRLQLRSEEGIHWSEDVEELLRLDATNPAHHFDLVLAFNVQLSPADIAPQGVPSSTPASPLLGLGRRNAGGGGGASNPTQRWMAQLSALLRPGGVFAGIACFDAALAVSAVADVAAATEHQSPALHGASPGLPHLSLPPSVVGGSGPLATPSAAPYSAMGALRSFRDGLEGLGYFVPVCVDLGMEGEVVFAADADENDEGEFEPPAGAVSPFHAQASRSPPRASPLPPNVHLESLVCARFFACKDLPPAGNTAGAGAAAPVARSSTPHGPALPLRRSVSTGAINIAHSGGGGGSGHNHAASNQSVVQHSGSPASVLPLQLQPGLGTGLQHQTRPLKIVTRPQVSPLTLTEGGVGGNNGNGMMPGFSPSHGGIGVGLAQFGQFPPSSSSSYQQAQQAQQGHRRGSSRASASPSPSPLSLPPTGLGLGMGMGGVGLGGVPASSGGSLSSCSSAGPSPKLSPSDSTDSLAQLMSLNNLAAGGVGGRLLGLHDRGSSAVPAGAGAEYYNASTLGSAASTPRSSSNQSSPGLYPATPHQSGPLREPIVITGVALGLPNATWAGPDADKDKEKEDGKAPDGAASPQDKGKEKGALNPNSVFTKLNFDRLFSGQQCIGLLSPEDKAAMVSMRAAQVSKDKATGKRVKTFLTEESQLIQVGSKMAPREGWGLAKEYGLPPHVMEVLDSTYELAICAGLEALRDAGFALKLSAEDPEEIGLPESMRDETGVIFASSFPNTESLVTEVTKKVRYETQQELLRLLQLPRPVQLEGEEGQAWKEAEYEYNRKLLFQLLVMANCQLAELIKARGPNIHLNTACSGTTQAVATAEDWMRSGRCKRVVVISADVATSPTLLPYLATGFLALGAASTLPTPAQAAAPFDARRKGMILGAGSVGLVLEYATSALARGATPKVELLGSHQGNSAFHATLMDSVSIAQQLRVFLRRVEMEQRADFIFSGGPEQAKKFTSDLVYFSHETFTSANGGCAKVEMEALANIWPGKLGGEEAAAEKGKEEASGAAPAAPPAPAVAAAASSCGRGGPSPLDANTHTGSLGLARAQILLANSKGLTGHPMGVGFEDVLAVESLHRDLLPPVANFQSLDPRLAPLIGAGQLSRGGAHGRSHCLRMAGGFGNQFCYVLYKKWGEAAQHNWAARLAASQAAATGPFATGRGQVHALRRAPGHYSYPLQIAESPNSCGSSAFISRVNSESDLQRLAAQGGADD